MFEGIGRNPDPDENRRRALATAIATLLVGSATSFVLAAGAWTAKQVLEAPPVDDTPMAFLELDEPPPEAEPPPLEPVRKGGGQQARQGSPDVAPEPEVPVEPTELSEPDEDPEVADAEVRGREDGTGDDDTTVDAPPGPGRPDGTTGGTGTGMRPVVHRSEVTLRRSVDPFFPREVDAGQACRVTVDIGEGGRPESIRIEECDAPYAREARRAIARWRWAREDAGKRTLYRVVFKGR